MIHSAATQRLFCMVVKIGETPGSKIAFEAVNLPDENKI